MHLSQHATTYSLNTLQMNCAGWRNLLCWVLGRHYMKVHESASACRPLLHGPGKIRHQTHHSKFRFSNKEFLFVRWHQCHRRQPLTMEH